MTRAGATLADVPSRIPWTALRSFAAHLDAGSALVKETNPDIAGWQGAERVPLMLADIYDALNALRWVVECANTPKKRRRPKRPKPYPRPGAKDGARKVGSAPIPLRDFDAWWNGG